MSWYLSHPLSGLAQRVTRAILAESMKQYPKYMFSNYKSIAEYAHLVNFKDIVSYKLSPIMYEGKKIAYQNFVKFSKETQEFILQAILSGNHPLVAAQAAGVSERNLTTWVKLGEAGVEPFASFFEECMKAQGYAGIGAMKLALGDDPDKAKQAKWWLSVIYPEIYGDRSRKSDTGSSNVTNIQQNNFISLSPTDRNNALHRLGSVRPEDIIG